MGLYIVWRGKREEEKKEEAFQSSVSTVSLRGAQEGGVKVRQRAGQNVCEGEGNKTQGGGTLARKRTNLRANTALGDWLAGCVSVSHWQFCTVCRNFRCLEIMVPPTRNLQGDGELQEEALGAPARRVRTSQSSGAKILNVLMTSQPLYMEPHPV